MYKRVLTIQDISCVGQCSLTVALPILSACGQETCILPSAVLSTHTGGFSGFTFRDLTLDIPSIWQHWKKENIQFDYIYTGYLGSTLQIGYVQDLFAAMKSEGCMTVVDPAMADNGKLYTGFDAAYAAAMTQLCAEADVMVPNITEACFMTGHPYQETYDEAYIDALLGKLDALGNGTVVLTGVGYSPEQTGVVIYRDGKKWYYTHAKEPKSYHGTGDVFASAFVGALASGKTMEKAVEIAAEYTALCIRKTCDDPAHWYGVKFETAIPELIGMLQA
ncbi:MAG: pyridoxamine kinase [Ruminococcaceae bacterium]|nr:pyridoxamine kinase [Oscillospiraceae bacterium]